MAIHLAVLSLHLPKNDILQFFQFLQKKVFRLEKKVSLHFWITLGVVNCKTDDRFIQIVQKIYFVKPGIFFLQKFENVIF